MVDQGSSNAGWAIAKGVLLTLGGLVAIGMVVSMLKPLLILGVLAGVGWFGYRLATSNKALGPGEDRKAITGAGDYDRRMAELDALDRKLDAEIRKHQ
jgi:hypothetical protein